jgi:hypothetical protein
MDKYKYDAAMHVMITARNAVEELLTLPKTLSEIIPDLSQEEVNNLKNEFELLLKTFQKITEASHE